MFLKTAQFERTGFVFTSFYRHFKSIDTITVLKVFLSLKFEIF